MAKSEFLFVSPQTYLLSRARRCSSQWVGCSKHLSAFKALNLPANRRVRIGTRHQPLRDGIPQRLVTVPKANLSALSLAIDQTVLRSSISAISKLLVTLLLGVAAAKRGHLDSSTLRVRIRNY